MLAISDDALFWVFGVELGIIDCSIKTIDDLRQFVNEHYTQEQVDEIMYGMME